MALQGDLETLKNVISRLCKQFSRSSRTFGDLQSLYKTIVKVDIALRTPAFKSRKDADRIARTLADLVEATKMNMQDMAELLTAHNIMQAKISSGRSPRQDPSDASRSLEVYSKLVKHTSGFQHTIDLIEGREDRSKLSPKTSRPPSKSPDTSSRRLTVDDGVNPNITISAAPSPYQPTVEDVEDTDDEDQVYDVQAYHVPPSEASTAARPKDTSQTRVPQTPPQVVVRSATDPTMTDSPRGNIEQSNSPLRVATGANDLDNIGDSSVTKISRKERTIKDEQQEIERLEAEVERLKMERSISNESKYRRSPHHQSVDLGHVDDYPHHDHARRQRASTTTGSERPKSYMEKTSPEGRGQPGRRSPRDVSNDHTQLKRTPSGRSHLPPPPSPRYTAPKSPRIPRSPQSAVEPRFDDYWQARATDQAQSSAEVYGTDPRTSLPTVLKTSNLRPVIDRTGRRSNRTSGYFDDPEGPFQDFFDHGDGTGADFSLFDPAPRESRKRAGSRAKGPLPGGREPSTSRVVTTELELEPTIREVPVSLEELFYGATKQMPLRRQRYNAQMRYYQEEEAILEIPISKGLKHGSMVKWKGAGDETTHGIKDVHFVLTEKPHPVFIRKGYDLLCTIEIPLVDALCGWSRTVTSICGRPVKVAHDGPTPARWKDCFAGLGMCRYKKPDQRGDLIVDISIKYPGPLSERQKRMVRSALENP